MPTSIKARCSYCSEWRSPWKTDGLRKNVCVTRWPVWIRGLRGKSGVYFIRDCETKEILYVGRGRTCLKSVLVRHFHVWGEDLRGRHYRTVFDRERVEVKFYLVRPEWVTATEADLIAVNRPPANCRPEVSSRSPEFQDEEVPF